MEFFREKNGKYHGAPLTAGSGFAASPVFRIVMSLFPLGIIAGVFFLSPAGAKGSEQRLPLMIGAGAVLFSGLVSFVLRKAGMGSDVIVDQMNGTVSFRKPGGNRQTVQISDLRDIVLNTVQGKAGILCLNRNEGSRHVLMYCKDLIRLRMFADELSTLTSLSVSEEADA